MTAILRILSAGPGSTVQDGGRHGYLRYGVTGAGPMDPFAHALANRSLGNPAGAAALEVSLGGVEVTAEDGPLTLAFAGGSSPFTAAGLPIARNAAIVEAGLDLAIGPRVTLGLSYNGQLTADAQDHGVKGGLAVRF